MNSSSQQTRLSGIVDWLIQKRQAITSTHSSDALYEEIHHLKKTLSTAPTKPTRVIRNKIETSEPVTEQQKLMDLAG